MQIQFSAGMAAFSISRVGTEGHPYTRGEGGENLNVIQKLTQNGR